MNRERERKGEEEILMKPFPYDYSIGDVSAGLNNTRQRDFARQRDFVKVKAIKVIINFLLKI